MCRGPVISAIVAPVMLAPRRFASCRSQPVKLQFYRKRPEGNFVNIGNCVKSYMDISGKFLLHQLDVYLTSKSAPASTAPRKMQFWRLAPFRVATRRFTFPSWLPSKSEFFKFTPKKKNTLNTLQLDINKEKNSFLLSVKVYRKSTNGAVTSLSFPENNIVT